AHPGESSERGRLNREGFATAANDRRFRSADGARLVAGLHLGGEELVHELVGGVAVAGEGHDVCAERPDVTVVARGSDVPDPRNFAIAPGFAGLEGGPEDGAGLEGGVGQPSMQRSLVLGEIAVAIAMLLEPFASTGEHLRVDVSYFRHVAELHQAEG